MARFSLYSSERWFRLRRAKLAASPVCELCPPDDRRQATCVDHKTPVQGDNDPLCWAWSNLQSLCWSCHSAKTARGREHGAVKTNKPRKGCDKFGRPIDPSHPWAQKPA
ncbi:MAG: HNH endonuclease [Alphaproteobacteria bacterium]|nr:HNH endonuclease [Alphaproteobacteria bacterium]